MLAILTRLARMFFVFYEIFPTILSRILFVFHFSKLFVRICCFNEMFLGLGYSVI